MATIDVKDASGATVAIEKPLVPGRTAAASSRPVALSTEDYAAIDGIEASLALLLAAHKAEDAAHASGDLGMQALTVRKDTAAATAGTDGDYQPMTTDANGRLHVLPAGNVAAGATDSGNPLKMGGKYEVTPLVLTDGQRGDVHLDSNSNVKVSLWAGNGATAVTSLADNADGVAASSNARNLAVATRSYVLNANGTYDRTRGDVNGAWVTPPSNYETVAASQTAQALGATGATGDYIDKLIIIPATTAPGVVTLLDNATSIAIWLGGTVGADLKPFVIELGMKSVSGAWKVTTGANVSVIGVGRFT